MQSTSRLRFLAVALLALGAASAQAAPPPGYCDVKVCNKLERFTLSPWKMLKDKVGETCSPGVLPKAEAVVGRELSSNSRWYQGSFNPTKKSVNRVKEVGACTAETSPVKK